MQIMIIDHGFDNRRVYKNVKRFTINKDGIFEIVDYNGWSTTDGVKGLEFMVVDDMERKEMI